MDGHVDEGKSGNKSKEKFSYKPKSSLQTQRKLRNEHKLWH